MTSVTNSNNGIKNMLIVDNIMEMVL